MTDTALSGGCLCGAVRFSARLNSREVGACHCGMCRRWTAGPFLGLECATLTLDDPAQVVAYRSSEWAERIFCKTCGSSLFYRLIPRDLYFVSAEAFDDQTGFALKTEGFIDEKPAHYTFADATRQLTGAEVFAAYTQPEE
ncbi:MAG TPA: GFA family protein [Rhizomicrobium sp.]|nr:GFA family protein [Rhizomicrobium sp.]